MGSGLSNYSSIMGISRSYELQALLLMTSLPKPLSSKEYWCSLENCRYGTTQYAVRLLNRSTADSVVKPARHGIERRVGSHVKAFHDTD